MTIPCATAGAGDHGACHGRLEDSSWTARGMSARCDNRAVGGARRLPMLVSARGDPNFQGHISILFNSSIFRSHFGFLAVPDHVFHMFLVSFLFLVPAHFCFQPLPVSWLHVSRDRLV